MTDKFGKELKIGDCIEFEIFHRLPFRNIAHIGIITDFGLKENYGYIRSTSENNAFCWSKANQVRLLTQEETMIYLMENA